MAITMCRPKAPWNQGTLPHLNYNRQKGKVAGCEILPYQPDFNEDLMTDTTTALAAADNGLEKSLERLFDFLRIPSISTDAAYKDACEKAARWLVVELTELGFKAE